MSSLGKFPCVKCTYAPEHWEDLVDRQHRGTSKTLQNFNIDKKKNLLGKGGFKEIYSIPNDPKRVLKLVYNPKKIASQSQFPSFIRNAIRSGLPAEINFSNYIHQYGSRFLKDRIPKVYAVYKIKVPHGDTIGILEDRLPGKDVSEFSKTNDENDIIAVACQGFKILSEMHAMGLVHHDLKPHNMKYDPLTKKLYFFDLGLSCSPNCCECKCEPVCNKKFTEYCDPDKLLGTPVFMSLGYVHKILQYRAKKYGRKRSSKACMESLVMWKRYQLDVFAMGVTIFMLLIGQKPFYDVWFGKYAPIFLSEINGKYLPEMNKEKMKSMETYLKDKFSELQKTWDFLYPAMAKLVKVLYSIFFGLRSPGKFDEKTIIPDAKVIFNKLHDEGLCQSFQKASHQIYEPAMTFLPIYKKRKRKRQQQQRTRKSQQQRRINSQRGSMQIQRQESAQKQRTRKSQQGSVQIQRQKSAQKQRRQSKRARHQQQHRQLTQKEKSFLDKLNSQFN